MTLSGADQGDLFAGYRAEVDDTTKPTAVGVWPTDCRNALGLRPCPFATCRHHLLLEFVYSNPTEPNLAINRAGSLVPIRGRRPELSLDASRAEVEAFADDAVAALWTLPDTCSREVARRAHLAHDGSDGPAMTFPAIAAVLGVADPDELAEEFAELRDGLRGEAIEAGGDPDVEEDAVTAIVGRGTFNPRR